MAYANGKVSIGLALGFGLATFFIIKSVISGFAAAFGWGLLIFTFCMFVPAWIRWLEKGGS